MWLATPKPNAPAIGAPMSTASNTGRPWALRKVASLVSIGHSFSVSTARSEGAWVTFGRRAACDPARGASELAAPCAVGERGLAFVRLELELVERARERRAQATADDDQVAARLADALHGGQAGGRRGARLRAGRARGRARQRRRGCSRPACERCSGRDQRCSFVDSLADLLEGHSADADSRTHKERVEQ